MRIVDANVLLYAVNSASHHHEPSRRWLDRALSGRQAVGLPWVVLLAFLRLTTRSALFPRPLSIEQASEQVRAWLDRPQCVIPEPTSRHFDLVRGLLVETGTGGNLVTDCHLAALAVEHGATVVSWDGDFARFRGVRVEQPTA